MPSDEIFPHAVYQHNEGGLHYQIDEILLDLTGYESAHEIGRQTVTYVQLEDGEKFPAGTPYSRSEEDFKQQFTDVTP